MIVKCGILAGVRPLSFCANDGRGRAARRRAQVRPADSGTVSGSGTVVLERKPDLLRLKVDLIAQGKTMKEALATLKDRREATQAPLGKLGCDQGIGCLHRSANQYDRPGGPPADGDDDPGPHGRRSRQEDGEKSSHARGNLSPS